MRDVLVVLFWIWLLVALGVYGYRIVRRVTRGPKATREEASGATLRSRLGVAAPPPLPEGPIEARLPEALRHAHETPPTPAEAPSVPGTPAGGDPLRGPAPGADRDGPRAEPPGRPHPAPGATTLAEALAGIEMPADLLPLVRTDEPGLVDGRRALFSATGTNVPTVTVALGEELRRLGYAVDGLDTLGSTRAGLTATRDRTAVSVAVTIDDDSGAVVVELNV